MSTITENKKRKEFDQQEEQNQFVLSKKQKLALEGEENEKKSVVLEEIVKFENGEILLKHLSVEAFRHLEGYYTPMIENFIKNEFAGLPFNDHKQALFRYFMGHGKFSKLLFSREFVRSAVEDKSEKMVLFVTALFKTKLASNLNVQEKNKDIRQILSDYILGHAAEYHNWEIILFLLENISIENFALQDIFDMLKSAAQSGNVPIVLKGFEKLVDYPEAYTDAKAYYRFEKYHSRKEQQQNIASGPAAPKINPIKFLDHLIKTYNPQTEKVKALANLKSKIISSENENENNINENKISTGQMQISNLIPELARIIGETDLKKIFSFIKDTRKEQQKLKDKLEEIKDDRKQEFTDLREEIEYFKKNFVNDEVDMTCMALLLAQLGFEVDYDELLRKAIKKNESNHIKHILENKLAFSHEDNNSSY